ncbi:MAG: winged helix-turn-helix domain-containing protein [Methylobacter sp.]|nr:winged helix-turn-helix domain-containing protein [Methylobacter sp.]
MKLSENHHSTLFAHYAKQIWQISYSESGMSQLLNRVGFGYKKPKPFRAKADVEKQLAFAIQYQELKASKAPERIPFFHAVLHARFLQNVCIFMFYIVR